MFPYAPQFVQNILDLYGAQGREWLEDLPRLIASFEARWNMRVEAPFPLSYNYVAPAVRADGTPVVFKIGVPDKELSSEMAALRHWDGRGIARLLESDPEQGAMLLERLLPGVPLYDLEEDDQATRIAAGVMRDLWVPAPPDPDGALLTAIKWGRGLERLRQTFGGSTGPFPQRAVERAEAIQADFLAAPGPPVLLHGDLHHWNILSAQRRPWLALDPKGVVGEAEYEIGPWMINKWELSAGKAGLKRQAARRLEIFSEMLGFDYRRIWGWALNRAVLSAWWTYEDNHRVDEEMWPLTEALLEIE